MKREEIVIIKGALDALDRAFSAEELGYATEGVMTAHRLLRSITLTERKSPKKPADKP